MSTFDRVKKIVVDQLGVNEADVQIDSTFIDDLGADSLDIVELINSGERNVFVQFNENSHFGSSFQGDNEKSLLIEIEKLKLSLSHCQQLLEEKEGLLNKLVEQKDNEIKLLREMVELLKKG